MTSKKFLAVFFLGLTAVAAVVIPFNMAMDAYGLFRSSAGRRLSIYGEERTAKYLHSFRYIPENFDGILLGSSISDNMETRRFPGYRVYNASINGGNVADLKPIVGNVYRRGGMKLTLLCIHRYLTLDHELKTDLMTPRQYWGALGSPQLITVYASWLAVRSGLVSGHYDEFGTLDSGTDPGPAAVRREIEKAVAEIRLGRASVGNYRIDPVALKQLGEVAAEARRGSQRLVVFYPPIPAAVYEVRSAEFQRYRDTIGRILDPGDVVVDFNVGSYAAMRADDRNFVDAVHLSRVGARLVISELGKVTAGFRPYPRRPS